MHAPCVCLQTAQTFREIQNPRKLGQRHAFDRKYERNRIPILAKCRNPKTEGNQCPITVSKHGEKLLQTLEF